MKSHTTWAIRAVALGIAAGLAAISGCRNTPLSEAKSVSALTRPAGEPGVGQQQFDSDDQAAAALIAAVKVQDSDALQRMFGPSIHEFVTGDKVEDGKAFEAFTKSSGEHMELEKLTDHSSCIDVGNDKWPFPIPLTRLSNGKWFFDTEAGKLEILARRVGANELEAIRVCHAYVEAQREYAGVDRDSSGVLKYAQHMISKNGHDGLYWDTVAGQEESPFGPLIAQATMEGYTPGKNPTPQPYHGYFFHILTRQGPAAPGGKYDYVVNGNMIAGFAMIAYPSAYSSSGVMTFIVNHQGKLYQKDLGEQTDDAARGIQEYNPDSSWTRVKE